MKTDIHILVVDCGSSKVPEIEQMLRNEKCNVTTIKWNTLNQNSSKNSDGIIISGAPVLLTQENPQPYLEKIKILLSREVPVLGICFGHQCIGLLNGAEVSRCSDDRDWQNIEVKSESSLFAGLAKSFVMKEDHCEQVSVPPLFKLTASSQNCENEAMEHTKLPIFGVQFHPEISGEPGQLLFHNFIKHCKP